jgi:methyl-accepting chemotaxis protein
MGTAPPEVLDFMLDMVANLPAETFDRALSLISGDEPPPDTRDDRTRVKEWMKRQGIGTAREDMKRNLLEEKENLQTPEDEAEYRRMEAILNGPDDGVIDLMLASVDDAELKKMSFYAHMGEAFGGPPEKLVLKSMATLAERFPEAKEEEEEELFDEDELIEQLNLLEFQRDKPAQGMHVLKAFSSGVPNPRLTQIIREVERELIKVQGGKLDRFKLRDLSSVELQHRLETTTEEIGELQQRGGDTRNSIGKVAAHFNAPAGLADLVAPDAYAYPVYIKKRLASELRLRIKQIEREPNKPQQEAERIAAEVQQMNDTITRLEQAREDAVRANPAQEAAIRKRFGKAIDAVKENA